MEFPGGNKSNSDSNEGEVTDSDGGSIESEEKSSFIQLKSTARRQKSMVNIKRKQKCMSRVMSKADLSVKMPSMVYHHRN